jgi:hypothetical protein
LTVVCIIRNKKERKLKTPYENNHRCINGVEYKLCLECSKWYPMNEEYFYKNQT